MGKEYSLDDGIEKKRCSKCQLYKPLDKFSLDKLRKDGLQNKCKSCYRLMRRKRRIPVDEKECGICHLTKPAIEFDQWKYNNDGLRRVCKSCGVSDPNSASRKCTRCFQERTLEHFAKADSKCGYRSSCYKCEYKRQLETRIRLANAGRQLNSLQE